MRALSILQPYAWLICDADKDIENRTWETSVRGWVLIHAGKRYAKQDFTDDRETYTALYGHYPDSIEEMTGGIVGAALIIGCVSHSDSPWFHGPHGFVIGRKVSVPLIPCKGKLGFFHVPETVTESFFSHVHRLRMTHHFREGK